MPESCDKPFREWAQTGAWCKSQFYKRNESSCGKPRPRPHILWLQISIPAPDCIIQKKKLVVDLVQETRLKQWSRRPFYFYWTDDTNHSIDEGWQKGQKRSCNLEHHLENRKVLRYPLEGEWSPAMAKFGNGYSKTLKMKTYFGWYGMEWRVPLIKTFRIFSGWNHYSPMDKT